MYNNYIVHIFLLIFYYMGLDCIHMHHRDFTSFVSIQVVAPPLVVQESKQQLHCILMNSLSWFCLQREKIPPCIPLCSRPAVACSCMTCTVLSLLLIDPTVLFIPVHRR